MKKNSPLPLLAKLALCTLSAQTLHAQTYNWDLADSIPILNNSLGTSFNSVSEMFGGSMTNLTASYNEATELFTWDVTLGRIPIWQATSTPDSAIPDGNRLPDSYTLIVNSGGGVPTSANADEVVQLNLDFTDLNNPLLTAYSYLPGGSEHDGTLLIDSQDTSSIQTLAVSQPDPEHVRIQLALDATVLNSSINSPNWEGLQFEEEIGVWFHYFTGTTTAYDANGSLTQLTNIAGNADAFWLDTDTLPTTTENVPEPSALFLLGISTLLGFSRRTR